MRYLHYFFFAMLLLFAAVQYNDPDWYYWGLVYLVAAAWSFFAAYRPDVLTQNPVARYGLMVSIILFLVGFASLFYTLGPGWIHVEEAREDLGYLICAVTSMVALWDAKRTAPR